MEFAELAQVCKLLDLESPLLRLQVLLHLVPLRERLLFLDLAERLVHACERFQEQAQAAACFRIRCRFRLLLPTQLSYLAHFHLFRVLIDFATQIDELGLELSQVGQGGVLLVVVCLVDEGLNDVPVSRLCVPLLQIKVWHQDGALARRGSAVHLLSGSKRTALPAVLGHSPHCALTVVREATLL